LTTLSNTYRIFVGAFPSGELAARIQALRERLDPITARITPPHVTIAGTYTRTGKPASGSEIETIQKLSHLNHLVSAFDLQLKGIGVFPRKDYPVIKFNVVPTPVMSFA
jgi:2'-5' RNA ligase